MAAARSLLAPLARRMVARKAGSPFTKSQIRALNVHEYVGLDIMKKHGVATPANMVATSGDEAESIANSEELGGKQSDVVIKAQILAGGRGKGTFKNGFKGGVHVVTHPGEAKEYGWCFRWGWSWRVFGWRRARGSAERKKKRSQSTHTTLFSSPSPSFSPPLAAEKMLGEYLVTKQTGEEGRQVNHVLLMERLYLRREMYFSILMDRKTQGPM